MVPLAGTDGKKVAPFLSPQKASDIRQSSIGADTNPKTFIVHKELACYHLLFFAKAFNGQFMEVQNNHMKLNDADVTTFGLLVIWVYHEKIEGLLEKDLARRHHNCP
ncbi:hypothetical protein QTJ16_004170 [Diplocarpon rosae]|uniref:BTB domain-containing protein n=1 Tax=Diplocarpon rosae TaxID=946125 RepID=A0AAD9T0C1_9HELO|nr:hypothetical protein QTJ16_004170 [Diplocarpon rosae]